MNTSLETYPEALQRVKIGLFAENGHNIKGVVHVGSHDGYEVEWYLKMGIDNILCFEPYSKAFFDFKEKYVHDISDGKVKIFDIALGCGDYEEELAIADGDGQGSTFLPLVSQDKEKSYWHETVGTQKAQIRKFTTFLKENPTIDINLYDCLVIDAQGMEMEVLLGMDNLIDKFDYLNIECSRTPIYKGELDAQSIIAWLKEHGFIPISEIEEHNDILFIKDKR